MDILSLDRNQAISSLTVGELETLINQIVNKVVSDKQESLIPDGYKKDIPYKLSSSVVADMYSSGEIPLDLWESVPSDASQNLDSYLYPPNL